MSTFPSPSKPDPAFRKLLNLFLHNFYLFDQGLADENAWIQERLLPFGPCPHFTCNLNKVFQKWFLLWVSFRTSLETLDLDQPVLFVFFFFADRNLLEYGHVIDKWVCVLVIWRNLSRHFETDVFLQFCLSRFVCELSIWVCLLH